jgi:hypothetical protein
MMVSRAATLESAKDDAPWARACRKEGLAPGEQILPTAVRSADSPCDLAKELWMGRGQCLEHSEQMVHIDASEVFCVCHVLISPLGL